MSRLVIPRGGTYEQTWFVSGVNLTGNYVSMKGYVNPSAGSPYVFDWNTSGGQLTVTGSTVSGGRIDASVAPQLTNLPQTIVGWWLERVTNTGKVYYYDAGRADFVFAATLSDAISTFGPAPGNVEPISFIQKNGSDFNGSEPDSGRSYVYTASIVEGTISMDGALLDSTSYTISTTVITDDTLTINRNLFNNGYVIFGVRA